MKRWLNLNQLDILLIGIFFGLFFVTRFTNLTSIPIFTDEAIYLRWSQIGSLDPNWRFIPLTDGKPPLFHWIVMGTIRVFQDPLVAGRVVSIFAGSLNLIGIWLLSHALFKNKTISHLSALLYLTSPFALLYDRLAVVDSLLTVFSVYSLFFAILLVKHFRLNTALFLGVSIGAGMLTKASGLLFLLLAPLTALLLDWKKSDQHKRLLKWAALLTVSAVTSQLVYNILRLSRFFYRIEQKNSEFIIPFSKFLEEPFAMTWGNAKSLFAWQVGYLSVPIAALIVIALLHKQNFREKLLLFGYYLAPFIAIATFNKIIFARFLLFSTPFLLILAAWGIFFLTSKVTDKLIKAFVILAVIFIPAKASYDLIYQPLQARIPQADRDQYLDSWPAGWGINETVAFFQEQADKEPIHIGTQGTFGLMPFALEIYLANHENVRFTSYWPVSTVPDEVLTQAKHRTTYFIYNELEDIPPQDNLELIMEFRKQRLDEVRHMRIFKVNPLDQSQ